MAPSPPRRFLDHLDRLDPLPSEIAAAEKHAQTIKTRLQLCFGPKTTLKMVGSHARGSAVRSLSDVDYFAMLPRAEARWDEQYVRSENFLNRVKSELAGRYQKTDISRSGQAVVLHFKAGERPVDVVPGFFLGFRGSTPIYRIPAGYDGQWLDTSPESHNRFLRRADEESRGKLKYLTQLVKFWKNCRSIEVPLSSLHVELLLSKSGICSGVKSYPAMLAMLFDLLHTRKCASFADPLNISGMVRSASSASRLTSVIEAVEHARNLSMRGIRAEAAGHMTEANACWNRVFNDRLP